MHNPNKEDFLQGFESAKKNTFLSNLSIKEKIFSSGSLLEGKAKGYQDRDFSKNSISAEKRCANININSTKKDRLEKNSDNKYENVNQRLVNFNNARDFINIRNIPNRPWPDPLPSFILL